MYKRQPNSTRTELWTQNTEDTLKTSIPAPPSLFRAWHFRAPPSHPRDPETDSFLACAATTKRGWRRRARDDAHRRSRLLPSVFVSRALCDMHRRYSDYISNWRIIRTWFPGRTRTRVFPLNRIEFNSIKKMWIDSIQKCASLRWSLSTAISGKRVWLPKPWQRGRAAPCPVPTLRYIEIPISNVRYFDIERSTFR